MTLVQPQDMVRIPADAGGAGGSIEMTVLKVRVSGSTAMSTR